MHHLNIRTKALAVAALFAVIIGGSAFYIDHLLERSKTEIIESNIRLAESAVVQLRHDVMPLLDSLFASGYFDRASLTKEEEHLLDRRLATIVQREFSVMNGMEGGYYFSRFDQFLGYGFPTSPSPKPAFGPPPRSYNIIRDQLRQSIGTQKRIVQIHSFDPALFPLVTEPAVVRGSVVGGVWARIHIERLLPTPWFDALVGVATALSVLGFAIALGFAWNLRRRLDELKSGLGKLHEDPTFRFPERKGVRGFIMRSINDMLEARNADQVRRQELESELRQREKMATLGTLIAGVAHEVKTPLAVIKTRIQMWQRKISQARTHSTPVPAVISDDSMHIVVHEIDRLSNLVKRLLVFSRPVAGSFNACDINQLLDRTLAVIRSAAEEKGVTITTTYDPSVPGIMADPQALEQVFLNICSNALDAMPGHNNLRMMSEYLPAQSQLRVTVQDDGVGIPDEIIDRVFDPFFTTKEDGVGLGLSICYEIIRAHGGNIEFVRPNGTGTTCRITLPLQHVNRT